MNFITTESYNPVISGLQNFPNFRGFREYFLISLHSTLSFGDFYQTDALWALSPAVLASDRLILQSERFATTLPSY